VAMISITLAVLLAMRDPERQSPTTP
jgi:hypothetical protein